MLPIPKKRKKTKSVIDVEMTNPRFEFMKRIEDVRKRAKKATRKNSGIAPDASGLTKYMIPPSVNQAKRVIISRGRKFLCFSF
jgi:hypothetical protein